MNWPMYVSAVVVDFVVICHLHIVDTQEEFADRLISISTSYSIPEPKKTLSLWIHVMLNLLLSLVWYLFVEFFLRKWLPKWEQARIWDFSTPYSKALKTMNEVNMRTLSLRDLFINVKDYIEIRLSLFPVQFFFFRTWCFTLCQLHRIFDAICYMFIEDKSYSKLVAQSTLLSRVNKV